MNLNAPVHPPSGTMDVDEFMAFLETRPKTNTRREMDLKLRRYREAPENLYAVVIEPREFRVETYASQ
jgi:hypothetical protein